MFLKVLNAETKILHADVTGVQKGKNEEWKVISMDEEKHLWSVGILSESSAETSIKTLSFYLRKLFGLRAKERRSLRLDNFLVGAMR